jgi:hypothetical protein
MTRFIGRYVIDLEASAKLHIGYFTDRFEMKAGYEEAMREYMHSHGDIAKKLTLALDATQLRLAKDNEEEVFPVKSLVEDGEKPTLVVLAGGRYSMTYELQVLGPDLVRFSNRHYDLHNWAWRRTADR